MLRCLHTFDCSTQGFLNVAESVLEHFRIEIPQLFEIQTLLLLASRYKLLESKLESTLKKSLEIKEEKIAALEARLEESTNLNQQLRQELKTVRKRAFFYNIK